MRAEGVTLLSVTLAAMAVAAPASAATMTFSNPSSIAIPESGTATPYPSTIDVSGLAGLVTDVNVTLVGFSHSFPFDVGVLLVGPNGESVVLFNGAGGRTAVSDLTLTFDDAAAGLPGAPLSSGTFLPSNTFPGDSFAAPAPPAPYGTTLAVFNGQAAAGTWQLFVQDFASLDGGSISDGWRLTITTDAPDGGVPEPSLLVLLGAGLIGVAARRRRTAA